MLRTILSLFIVIMFSTSAIALPEVRTACQDSPLELDCACVVSTFETTAADTSPTGQQALLELTKATLGLGDNSGMSKIDPMVMMSIVEKIDPIIGMIETCEAKPSAASFNTASIVQNCAASPFPLDCGCVGTRASAAAEVATPRGKEILNPLMLDIMEVGEMEENETTGLTLAQNETMLDTLGDVRSICAIPSEPGLSAARSALAQPITDFSLQSRAEGPPSNAKVKECMAFGNAHPYCACAVSIYEADMSPAAAEFMGYLSQSEARLALGLTDDHIQDAADRAGHKKEYADDLRAQSNETLNLKNELAAYACEANMEELGLAP